MPKEKISSKQTLQLKDATAYLEALVTCFKRGKIVVEKDGEFLSMTPAENISIEVSAKSKKGKGRFSLELSWKEEEGGPLTISDKEPESKPEMADKVAKEESKQAVQVEEVKEPVAGAAEPASATAPVSPDAKSVVKKVPAKKAVAKKPAAKKPAPRKTTEK